MYKGKLQFVFKHFPLGNHTFAKPAAIASMAAHKQGKFFAYHDLLFQNMGQLKQGRSALLRFAKQLGLNMKQFQADLDSTALKEYIENDTSEGNAVGVNGTPSFFVNGKIIKNSGIKGLQTAINAALLKKGIKQSELPKGLPPTKIKIGNAPFKGGENAKVTIVEFSDFQCPFCSTAGKALSAFAKAYGDKIKLVFKQNPLPFHKQAHLAAQAALAAHEQAKFWGYHDLLFANQKQLKKPDLLRYAQQLSMDLAMFKKSLESGKFKGQVDADLRQGREVGVSGTPTIFINNKQFKKSVSFENLMKVVNPLLIKAGIPDSAIPQAPPAIEVDPGQAPSKGPANAPVTIVEFSDFQCPFCSRVIRPINQIARAYGKKVRVVFKQYPLSFHKQAHLAAQASLAAYAQGKFWAYHDLLFNNQKKLQKSKLLGYAKQLKLDLKKFQAALDNGTYKAQVDADLAQGSRIGVSGTPTLYINGQKMLRSINFKTLRLMIDPLLLKQGFKRADLPTGPPPVKVKLHGIEPFKGGENAKVTIVEFSDFQCPFCSRAAVTIGKISKAYGDKIKLVFKHYPLYFHKQAPLAAQASMAAHAQGKFWAYHDKLFANQRKLKKPDLLRYAKQLGMDLPQFKKALDTQVYKSLVEADLREGRAVGVNGTPAFFINGKLLSGAQPFSRFKQVIDAALRKAEHKK